MYSFFTLFHSFLFVFVFNAGDPLNWFHDPRGPFSTGVLKRIKAQMPPGIHYIQWINLSPPKAFKMVLYTILGRNDKPSLKSFCVGLHSPLMEPQMRKATWVTLQFEKHCSKWTVLKLVQKYYYFNN